MKVQWFVYRDGLPGHTVCDSAFLMRRKATPQSCPIHLAQLALAPESQL